jgi:hypothetical protein
MSPSAQAVRSEATRFSWPPQGVTRAPYQLFTDPQIYKLEQERIFRGKTGISCASTPKSRMREIIERQPSGRRRSSLRVIGTARFMRWLIAVHTKARWSA